MVLEDLITFENGVIDLPRPDAIPKTALQRSTNMEFRGQGYLEKRMGVNDYDAVLNTLIQSTFPSGVLSISAPYYPKTKPSDMAGEFILLIYGKTAASEYHLYAFYNDGSASWVVDTLSGLSKITYTSNSDLYFTIGSDKVIVTDNVNRAHYVSTDEDGNIISGVLGIPSPSNKAEIEAMDGFDVTQYEANANQDYLSVPGLFQCTYTVSTEKGDMSNPAPLSLTHDMQWFKVASDGSQEQWINQVLIKNLSIPDVSADLLKQLKYFNVYIRIIPYSEGEAPYQLEYSQQFKIVNKTDATTGVTGNNYLVTVAATPGRIADYENDVAPIAKVSAELNGIIALGNTISEFGLGFDKYVEITINNINSRTYVDGVIRIRLYDESGTSPITGLDWGFFDSNNDDSIDIGRGHLIRIIDNDRITQLPVVYKLDTMLHYADVWVSIPQLPAATPYTIYLAWSGETPDDTAGWWDEEVKGKRNIVALAKAENGIVVGVSVHGIHRSTNFGVAWASNYTYTSSDLWDVCYAGDGYFVIVGKDNIADIAECYYSNDYGKTWTRVTIDGGSNDFKVAVSVAADNSSGPGLGMVVAVGQFTAGSMHTPNKVGAYYTNNGGVSWTLLADYGATYTTAYSVYCDPTGSIWAGFDAHILHLSIVFPFSVLVKDLGSVSAYALFYVSASSILAGCSNGAIYQSTDDGVTWQIVGASAYQINGFALDTNGDVYAVSGAGIAAGEKLWSHDSGATWAVDESLGARWSGVESRDGTFNDIICVGTVPDNVIIARNNDSSAILALIRKFRMFEHGTFVDFNNWDEQLVFHSERVKDADNKVCCPMNYSLGVSGSDSLTENRANSNSNLMLLSGETYFLGMPYAGLQLSGNSKKIGKHSVKFASDLSYMYLRDIYPGVIPDKLWEAVRVKYNGSYIGSGHNFLSFQDANDTIFYRLISFSSGGSLHWSFFNGAVLVNTFNISPMGDTPGVDYEYFILLSFDVAKVSLFVVNLTDAANTAIESDEIDFTKDATLTDTYFILGGAGGPGGTAIDNSYYDQALSGANRYFQADTDKNTVMNMANFMPAMDTVIGHRFNPGDIETHNNEIIFAETKTVEPKTRENMLRFSKVNGFAFPETQYKLLREPIKRVLSAPSFLRFEYGTGFIVMTRNTINRMVVSGVPSEWALQTDNVIEEYNQYGLLAPRSLVRAGAYLFWLSELGVMRWGVDGLIPISRLRKEIELSEDLIGFYNPIRNQYILSEKT